MYARVAVSGSLDGPWKPLRLLVDTGASCTMLPRKALVALGIRPRYRQAFRLGDGRKMRRDMGFVYVRYRKRVAATQVIFGEPGDASVLGVLTLEELALRLDPRSGRLREIRVLPMIPAVTA